MHVEEQLLTFKEAMAYLKVSRLTMYRMIREKQLKGFKVGVQWRFTLAQLKACVKPVE